MTIILLNYVVPQLKCPFYSKSRCTQVKMPILLKVTLHSSCKWLCYSIPRYTHTRNAYSTQDRDTLKLKMTVLLHTTLYSHQKCLFYSEAHSTQAKMTILLKIVLHSSWKWLFYSISRYAKARNGCSTHNRVLLKLQMALLLKITLHSS